jgi:hypothetical protein
LEPLEDRRVMTADWQNPGVPEDVDGSGFVSVTDLVRVVLALRTNGNPIDLSELPVIEGPPPFLDVTGDDQCSLQDLLAVVGLLRDSGV